MVNKSAVVIMHVSVVNIKNCFTCFQDKIAKKQKSHSVAQLRVAPPPPALLTHHFLKRALKTQA